MIVMNWMPVEGLPRFFFYVVPYLIIGYDILVKAAKGVWNRRPLDENLLMSIATIGAMGLAVYEDGDYVEGIAVMLFYQVGEWFQSYAVGRSRRNIGELMDIRPDYANVEDNGKLCRVDPDEVEIGTEIIVQPGEKIPLDGIITEGASTLNTSALTGESLPRDVEKGHTVVSGCITNRRHPRSWSLSRTPAHASRARRHSSRVLPAFTRRSSSQRRFCSRSCRLSCALLHSIFHPIGEFGSTAP